MHVVALLLLCFSSACLAAEMQRLRLNVTGGLLNIVSEWGNKCLDLPGGSTNNGNLLQIWDCNGMTNQQWLFDSGSWTIRYGGNSGKCIDALEWSGNGGAGTKLGIWDCNGHDSQSWGYDSNMKTIYLAHSADRSNANLCMDLIGGATQDGTQIQVWGCNGHTNQAWDIRGAGPSPGPGGDGTIYMFRHGEKNSAGDLSSTGRARAKYIATIFGSGGMYHQPQSCFAGRYGRDTPQRTLHTIQPLASKFQLHVDNDIENHDHSGAAKQFLAKINEGHGVVAVAWEHANIHSVCYALASESMCPYHHWSGSDYDSVLIYTVRDGRVTSIEHKQEGFKNIANATIVV